jgi:prolyl-tRNA synthetase
VTDLENFITGANETGFHVVGANWGKDFILPELIVDLRKSPGRRSKLFTDPNQTLQSARGIEVGHIFQLGYKYSQAMNAFYTNEAGESTPFVWVVMGLEYPV